MEPASPSTSSLPSSPAGAAAPPPAPDLTGRTLGDYHLLRSLGQGGMGQVYLAEQISLNRKVALKMLRPETAANPVALARFEQEAKAVAQLTHSNIVQVYQTGEIEGHRYMALEYVEGRNLRDFLARKGPPDVLLALSIMRQVAAALHRASESGIIHRDIKPENILLTRKNEVKVADFGLSRVLNGEGQPVSLTQSGVTMGTPLYMSPEQVEGKSLDCRTDIYSFGVTCYHMLAGQPPFTGETAFEVALKHVRDEPRPLRDVRPDLPEALCAVVHKMLAKEPARRHQTPRELQRDVQRVREGLSGVTAPAGGITAEPAPAAAPPEEEGELLPVVPDMAHRGWRSWRWLPLYVGLSLLLAAACGVAFAWWRRPPADPLPPARDSGADTSDVDQVFRDKEHGQKLKAAVDQHLDPANGYRDVPAGMNIALELSLFYLDHNRLDDAERLFSTLENQPRQGPARSYWILGHAGRGIVFSLRAENQLEAQAANRIFSDLDRMAFRDGPRPRPGDPRRATPDHAVWVNPRFVAYVVKALDYNRANGVKDEDVPVFFRSLRGGVAAPVVPAPRGGRRRSRRERSANP